MLCILGSFRDPVAWQVAQYEENWKNYLQLMKPVLHNVRAWYPSDEPDLRMPVETLQTIIDVLKRDTPSIDVLITLSNLAIPPNSDGRQKFNLTDVPANADIVTFDIYCDPVEATATGGHAACGAPWSSTILPKLSSLAAFAAQHAAMRIAVIPDATSSTFAAIGGVAQRALNDRFLRWCAGQKDCVAVLPFVGGHWEDVVGEGAAYSELVVIGEAVRAGDWQRTEVGAAVRLPNCPLGGELTHVPCVDRGCDFALLPLDGIVPKEATNLTAPGYIDYCNAGTSAGAVDKNWTCCKAKNF